MGPIDPSKAGPARAGLSPLTWLLPVQALLTGCALLMSVWAHMPWAGTLGLALLGMSALASEFAPVTGRSRFWKWGVAVAWCCTLLVPATLLLSGGPHFTFQQYLDQYFAVLAWLIAAAILPATHPAFANQFRAQWKVPVLVWAFTGGLIWLSTAYARNLVSVFLVGVVINAALLLCWKAWFQLPFWATQLVNTALLLLIATPLADRLFHPAYHLQSHPKLREQLYSYDEGHKNPVAYAVWWDSYLEAVDGLERDILCPDPAHYLPYRLIPGSHGQLFQSTISINKLGFRGPEIPAVKGDTYRIVALGESTTFGITLNAGDRPWPALLEELIRERVKPGRPVEVINAGVPGYSLDHNLFRFATDILPLHPDLLISYHGVNGFPMLDEKIPSNLGPRHPVYRERPVRFLADCEYHLKMLRYLQSVGRLTLPAVSFATPLASPYADAYRRLITLARSNHIALVLGNFSMAVNSHSDASVIRFYQTSYPNTPALIQANEAHTRLLDDLAPQFPDVTFVDTHAHLDGHYQDFLDLVHFAPGGDRQLAENFFNGIQDILKRELARPVAQGALTKP